MSVGTPSMPKMEIWKQSGLVEPTGTASKHWEDKLPAWTYNDIDGAAEWGLTFPDANGKKQSPIDINSREAEYDENLSQTPLNFNYNICRETDVFNNGHSVVVNLRYKPGDAGYRTDQTPKSTMNGGPLPTGHHFELTEFRFHWGKQDNRGSEHTVNLKAFPMELHLIHYNCTLYNTLEEALGKPDGVAIVALFILLGRDHSGLKLLSEALEFIQYKGRQRTLTTAFSPKSLLPDPILRDYWCYEGSFTSPPCSENVMWIILRYPLTVCHEQLEEFRRLRTHMKGDEPPEGEDGILADNFRSTQPLNDRVIRASFL